MATRNTFEEVLRLVIEAGGKDDVELLLKQLDALQAVSEGGSKATLELADKLKNLAATAGQIQAYTRLKGEIAETATAIAKESEKLVQLKTEIDAAEKPSATLTRTYEKSRTALDGLLTAQNRQSVALQKTEQQLVKAGVDTRKLGASYQQLQHEIDGTQKNLKSVADGAGKVAAETNKAGGSVDKLKNSSASAAESLKSIALKFSAVAIAAEVAHKALEGGEEFFGSAIDSAKDLESALAEAGAVTGATAEDMKRLKAAAEDAAHATKFSALDAAKGLTELGRAGFSAAESVKALPATLNLAQAAGIEVAASATLMAQTLAEFGLGADQAAHVTDLLAKAAKSGGLGLDGLADELAKTAPLARQLGLSADDTVATLAALAKEGFRGKLAAGALRDVFVELADPTSKFATKLRELGIETDDFNKVIVELSKRGQEGKDALLELSAKSRPAIAALVADGGAKLRELQGDLKDAAGTAAETAKAMDDTLAGGFNAIGKSYEELKVALLTPILGPLKDELRELAEDLDKFAKSPDFAEIRKALGQLFVEGIKGVNEFIHSIDLHKLAESIKSFVGDAKTTITEFRDNLSGIITTVKVIYEAFKFVFHGIEAAVFLAATAIAKLVSALATVAEKLEYIEEHTPQGFLAKKLGLTTDTAAQLHEFAGGVEAVADAYNDHLGKALVATTDDFQAIEDAASSSSEGTAKSLDTTTQAATETTAALDSTAAAGTDAASGLDAVAASADKTTVALTPAEKAAKSLKIALSDLGITSQKELQDNADKSSRALDTLVKAFRSGTAAVEDVRAGFVKYAEAQRAAAANSDKWKKEALEDQLAVKASILGVTDSLDHMGRTGEHAGDRIAHGAEHATASLRETKHATDEAAASTDAFAESTKTLDTLMRNSDGSARQMAFSLGAMSQAAADAYRETNKYVASQPEWAAAINGISRELRHERNALKDVNDELDKQLAKTDPLADRINALRAQYKYVDDATLRSVAEKQQRVEDEAKRSQEEAGRAQADRSKAYLDTLARDRANAGTGTAAGDGSHPLTNPNLANARSAAGSHSTFAIKLELPSGAHNHQITAAQLDALLPQLFAQLKRELETMVHR